jgi:GxxExxY protein
LDLLSQSAIGAALHVHSRLGPGLLESAYESCLGLELLRRGHRIETQKRMPITYEGQIIDCGYRIDLLVDDELPLELKACERVLPVHEAQLLSYLRLGGFSRGLLINFHVPQLTRGIRRIANGWAEPDRKSSADSA